MSGLGAFYQAKSLGMSDGMANAAGLLAENRERDARDQDAKTQKLLEEQNKLLRNQQNAADAQQVAEDSAARERRDDISAEEERVREAQSKREWQEKQAGKKRRAQIAKDLISKLQKLFASTKTQHPDFEEASGSLQDLAALNASRKDSGSSINVDLWIKAGRLEKLIEIWKTPIKGWSGSGAFFPMEDFLSEADKLEKLKNPGITLLPGETRRDGLSRQAVINTLKEQIPVFISYHAEQGTIPAKPLAALEREEYKLHCIDALHVDNYSNDTAFSEKFSYLKNEYYWCPQSGYHHVLELVCPDEDLKDADKYARRFKVDRLGYKYGDEYLDYFLPKNRPAFVASLQEFAAVSAGRCHCLGLGPTGRVYGWGRDRRGQASPSDSIVAQAIAAGGWHGLALKNDGSVVGWGHDEHGQATPPEGLQGVLTLAAGEYHSLAHLNNGTVFGWGNNDYGQITPPEGLGGVIAIAAGESHSLALLNNGTVVSWGKNTFGQAQPPKTCRASWPLPPVNRTAWRC